MYRLVCLLLLVGACHAQLSLHTDANTNSFTLKTPGLQQSFTRYYGGAKTQTQLQQQQQQVAQPEEQQQQQQQLVSIAYVCLWGCSGIYYVKQKSQIATTSSDANGSHGIAKAKLHLAAHLLAKHLDALIVACRGARLHQLLNLCNGQHHAGAQVLPRKSGGRS